MSFEKKLTIFFSAILIGVIAVGIATLSNRKKIYNTDYWVQHTHRELYIGQVILSTVQDIETRSDEYVITGDSSQLDQMTRSITILHEQIKNLENLNYNHLSQPARIAALKRLIGERVNLSLSKNRLRKQRAFTLSEQLEFFKQKNQLLYDIRKTISSILQEENNVLLNRQAALEKNLKNASAPFLYLAVVFLLIIIIFFIIRHNYYTIRKAEVNLRQINSELTQSIMVQKQQQEELKNQAVKLQDVNEELKAFSYKVSHDLKNPLSVIKYTSDKIYKNYKASFTENDQKLFGALVNQASFMNDLITDLLQYALAGYDTEKKEEVDINETVKEIIKKYETHSTIKFKIINNLPYISFAKTQITQVFDNLIGNAVKYMDKSDGYIKIGVEDAENYWKFYVHDNGQGIHEKYLNKLFQPFQKAHERKDIQSTGIGLSIIKKIIENAGGKVWVKTEIGKGSIFYFTVPKFK